MAASTKQSDQSWVKHPANPVLGGDYGTCFDISVLQLDGTFRMYFSWRPKRAIAVAESVDGITWSDPVIVLTPRDSDTPAGFENEVNRPSVVLVNGRYHMWYTGQHHPGREGGRSWIGYASSDDGVRWTRELDEAVLAPILPWEKVAVMCPHVLWDSRHRQWKMWYSAGEQYEPNAIGYATSVDGITWQRWGAGPIFSASSDHSWEQHKVTACQVLQHQDWYWMFYVGFHDEHRAQIGLARSRDGVTGWERSPFNPIIYPTPGSWDEDACYKPFAVLESDRWLLWYNGRQASVEQIGLVECRGSSLNWDERDGSPSDPHHKAKIANLGEIIA